MAVNDNDFSDNSGSWSVIIQITRASPTIAITTTSLPDGTFGSSYTAPALAASGGASPYTFAATGLPTGLTLNTSTGVISGTPTQSGTFTVNVTATDSTASGNGGPFTSAVKTLSLTIAPSATTTTALSVAPTPSQGGQAVTLTADVTATGATPTGNVTFYVSCPTSCVAGFQSIGTAALSGGRATLTSSNFSAMRSSQVYSIKAIYEGTGGFQPSESSVVSHTVNTAPTSTALTASPNPGTAGQPVTLTATVSRTNSTPFGSFGVVFFYDGTTLLGQPAIDYTTGVATLVTSALSVGPHTLTARFRGSIEHADSDSAGVSLIVSPGAGGATTTALTASPSPSQGGQAVTLTADVTGIGGTPSGSVTFFASCPLSCPTGFQSIGTATLVGGRATFISSAFSALRSQQIYTLKAVYAGDGTFQQSESSTVSHTVTTAPTSTVVVASPNPGILSQPVTLTATVSRTNSTPFGPFGVVFFYDGGTLLGQPSIDYDTGIATLTTSALGLGAHTITAQFRGSIEHADSNSAPLSLTIAPSAGTATTTALATSPNPSQGGQAVTLTATVAAAGSAPSGNVTFYATCQQSCATGFQAIGSATLSGGVATFSISSFSAMRGSNIYTIKAIYEGSGSHQSSESATVAHTVTTAPTTTTLVGTPNPSVLGQAVTLTATVSRSNSTPFGPFGVVFFYDGATLLGQPAIDYSTGVATLTTSALSAGSHTITAQFRGSIEHADSNSSPFTLSVTGNLATTTTLQSSANPAQPGATIALTATVAASAGVPTGTVVFREGGVDLGSGVLSGGVATYSTSALAVGTHSITAVYLGTTALSHSTSAPLLQVVQAPTITVTTASLSGGTFGTSYTSPALAASGGASPYTFAATGLPNGLTLNTTTGAISGTPTQAGTFTVNVTATDSTTAGNGGPFSSAAKALTLVIAPPTVTVSTTSLPAGTFGVSYTAPALAASGGVSPYTWAATGLPSGLTLDAATGVISGNQTQSGTFIVNVTATDSTTAGNEGPFVSAVKALTLAVGKAGQTISFTKPADVAFASGLAVPLTASATSNLTVGFASLTASVCTITGASATIVGIGTCTIRASQAGDVNFNPALDVIQSFNVLGAAGLSMTSSASPNQFWRPGQSITLTYVVTNTGNVPVGTMSVSDTRIAPIACASNTLAAGATTTCTGSFITTGPDLLARGVTLTAIARGVFNGAPVASTTVTTRIGLDEDAIRRATTSSIQGFLGQRANLLTSSGPDVSRFHSRLGDGAMFGDGTTPEPPASTGLVASPAMPGRAGLGGGVAVGGSGGLGTALSYAAPGLMPGSTMGTIDRLDAMQSALGGTPQSSLQPFGPASAFGLQREYEMAAGDRRATASPFMFSGSADNGMGRFSFATSLSQLRAAAAAEDEQKRAAVRAGGSSSFGTATEAANVPAAAASALGLTASAPSARPTARTPTYDVWVEGVSSYFSQSRIDGRRQGHTAVVYAGADAVVMPGLLVGVMAQMDWMSETSSTIGHNASGRGWMVGPYASARLTRNLFFDARVLWGQSTNQIDPLGVYVDTFMTDRLLASAKLTGDWTSGAFRFRPSAEVIYFTERQRDYINVLGISIPDQSVSLGRLMIGPEISYKWQMPDKSVFEPFVGLKGIWDFAKTQETTAAGMPVGSDGLRGRVEAGATYRMPSGVSVRAGGAFDGIGGDGYRAFQGQAVVTVPLQ